MIHMTREEIIALYESGGFLAEYAPMHDWWKYSPDYKPIYEAGGSLAKKIEVEIPRQMKKDGELEIAYGDIFTKMYIYKLGDTLEEATEDTCGNCHGSWPCDCDDPVQVCNICGSAICECKCDECNFPSRAKGE